VIYLHKLLPLLVSPTNVLVAVILIGLVTKRYLQIYVAAILFLCFSMPIVSNALVRHLEDDQIRLSPSQVKPADAIVVLGGMLTTVKSSNGLDYEWVDPDRYFAGLELALQKKAPYIIFSDGKMPWDINSIGEGSYLKQKALSHGLSESQILLTFPVQNTEEEVRAIIALMQSKPFFEKKHIILVTSAFHMSRAKKLFTDSGFFIEPYPVDFKVSISELTPMSFISSANALRDSEFALRELMGRFYYSIRGFVAQQ
jgi:uncharacterized SAM-binding protein YcdF (DUF218 family)